MGHPHGPELSNEPRSCGRARVGSRLAGQRRTVQASLPALRS